MAKRQNKAPQETIAKALRLKETETMPWIHIVDGALYFSATPQLMAETSSEGLIKRAYGDLVNFDEIELVTIKIMVI